MSKTYCNSDYNSDNQYKCGMPCPKPVPPCPDSSYVVGNSVDFTVGECDSEIKADVTVSYRDTVRVWGQIRDCDGNPVPCAYLKLIRITNNGYVGVAHTITDCLGFYQFDLCPCTDGSSFRLLVSKASMGGVERTVSTGLQGTNCNPCTNPCLPPCDCK